MPTRFPRTGGLTRRGMARLRSRQFLAESEGEEVHGVSQAFWMGWLKMRAIQGQFRNRATYPDWGHREKYIGASRERVAALIASWRRLRTIGSTRLDRS